MTEMIKRVFSAVQPTGNLHLGNYLGAIQNFVSLQNHYECLYCIADLHAITVPQNPVELKENTYEVTAAFLAAGVDAKQHIVFNQSRVGAHAELAWILNCVARVGWLNRMTQFKEKAGKHRENASVGLYIYPNLMAADILAYCATHVPVGDDQKQHLELVRDIAKKFNHDFCGTEEDKKGFFPLPEPLITGMATRVMSLRDGKNKMSKSDMSNMSRITMTDGKDEIVKKIKKAKTDSFPIPTSKKELVGRPEAENLLNIFSALSDCDIETVFVEYGGRQFSEFKSILSDLMVEKIAPIGDEMKKLLNDVDYLDMVLKRGAEKADALAQPILKEVKERIGFAV